ncbi:competence type IV pilus minor pilin ComGG [Bacillus benzoevorans]|uniref:Competence protein ComGG n=1 Tax=Bacillus benzoevorans TaxID=1456 RepID=A0A7X0HS72_9BACI|nr:competence type IV pilus minor pilin ComGG [Bacillus benzoevorans]MBB6444902.1 competence protein ComGG [Bacillus benzoevorans]
MVRNEQGFMYPLTLCFLLLFSTILLLSMEHFLTVKKMTKETENILMMDTYIIRTVQVLEEKLAAEEPSAAGGTFSISEVQVEYSIKEITDSVWDISIFIKKEQVSVFQAHAYYDRDLGKIFKWIEM